MVSDTPPTRAHEDHKHTTREILEAFQNLLYLIHEDAGDSYRVRAYVSLAEKLLHNVHTGPCCCLERGNPLFDS